MFVYTDKTKESTTSQKPDSLDFSWIVCGYLNKGKSNVPPLCNSLEVLSSISVEAQLFAKNVSRNSNLDDSGISLPVFPSRTSQKLHNISITPKMVTNVIMNLDLNLGIWSWLYSSGGSKELWALTFCHHSWTLQ